MRLVHQAGCFAGTLGVCMRSTFSRPLACCTALFAVACWAGGSAFATDVPAAAAKVQFDIAAQPLNSALNAFALQSHQQILFTPEVVKGKSTQGIRGSLAPDTALAQLLAGTGLSSSKSADGMTLVAQADEKGASANPGPQSAPNGAQKIRNQASPTSAAPLAQSTATLEEVVVTAEKKSERLQDVPVPVTVLSAASLLDANHLRIQDYYTDVPGLNFAPDGRGNPNIAIRGITTGVGVGNPTVSITVDDVAFGPSSTYAAGGISVVVPDLDPGDLERVEVLRGPQGTLYGASSIGGLLKFVTVAPSTDGVSGRIQAGGSSIHDGGTGYDVRGSVNVPLSETLAIRASGFTREDPGYIDDIESGRRDVNRVDVSGGHFAALWQPSEALTLKLGALIQKSTGYGLAYAYPDLQQNELPQTGTYSQTTSVYSATLTAKLGAIDLTAVSGYSEFKLSDAQDWVPIFGSLVEQNYGVGGAVNRDHDLTRKYSQEIRLSGGIGSRLDWLLGGFYTRENSQAHQYWLAEDPATLAVAGSFLNAAWPTTYTEYAAFTDLTLHVTDRFDVQVGGRESRNRQTYSEVDGADYGLIFLGTPGPVVTPEVTTNDSAFTYLVTPRLKVSEDLMFYARLASGYRPGGPNPVCTAFGLPCHFEPDKTRNYELGVKGNVLDRTLSFDASLYYIDWKDVQLSLYNLAGSFYGNAGGAKSQGVELALHSQPATGLTLGAWIAFNDAKLTAGFPPFSSTYGAAGDRLPDSSRFSGNLSIEQQFPLTARLRGFAGASFSYVGDRLGSFMPTSTRQVYPGYSRIDLRTGLKFETWTTTLVVSNLTDQRGELAGGLATVDPATFAYIQPRTVDLQIAKTF